MDNPFLDTTPLPQRDGFIVLELSQIYRDFPEWSKAVRSPDYEQTVKPRIDEAVASTHARIETMTGQKMTSRFAADLNINMLATVLEYLLFLAGQDMPGKMMAEIKSSRAGESICCFYQNDDGEKTMWVTSSIGRRDLPHIETDTWKAIL